LHLFYSQFLFHNIVNSFVLVIGLIIAPSNLSIPNTLVSTLNIIARVIAPIIVPAVILFLLVFNFLNIAAYIPRPLTKNNNVIRPLIECSRKEILKYCKENDLNPCHDESNDEDVYTRIKIRLNLIPYVEKNINSNVIEAISRTSKIIEEQEDFVSIEIDKAYNDILVSSDYNCITFSLKKFNNLHAMIRKRLVLKAISTVLGTAKDIEKVHIDEIVKMCKNNVGGKYLTPNKNIKVSISNHKIHFEKI
jgi:hypothetical protein